MNIDKLLDDQHDSDTWTKQRKTFLSIAIGTIVMLLVIFGVILLSSTTFES